MKTINILDPRAIDRAVLELEDLTAKVDNLSVGVIKAMAEVGQQTAQEVFDGAAYAGDSSVSVTAEPHGREGAVVASGPSVAFIEFGSGVTMGQGPTLERPAGWELGTYGHKQGGHPPWVYKGSMGKNVPAGTSQAYRTLKNGTKVPKPGYVITHGNPPAGAMLQASEEMYDEATRYVKEEVKKW